MIGYHSTVFISWS